jgi:Leucine-rich repeat (LRR) protein
MILDSQRVNKLLLLLGLSTFGITVPLLGQDSIVYSGEDVSAVIELSKTIEVVTIRDINTQDVFEILSKCKKLRVLGLDRYSDSPIKISKDFSTKVEFLSINASDLKTVPNWVYQCTNLKRLFLDNNKISTIDSTIKDLTRLEVLDLAYNKIKKLSQIEAVNGLDSLTKLSLKGNKKIVLDTKLKNIEKLNLRHVKLRRKDRRYFKDKFPSIESVCILNPKYGRYILYLEISIECSHIYW